MLIMFIYPELGTFFDLYYDLWKKAGDNRKLNRIFFCLENQVFHVLRT